MRGVRAFLRRCAVFVCGILCFIAVSCADSEPRVVSAKGSVVFDYASEDSFPVARLAVFVQTESEVRRVSSVQVDSRESGYRWHISAPRMFKSGDRQWVCYTNLLPPEHDRVPQGAYDVRYIDAAGEEAEAGFTIAYAERLLRTKAEGVSAELPAAAEESVALYNADDVLIYFGRRKDSWNERSGILRDYGTAAYLRRCISADGERVVCLLPAEPLLARTKKVRGDE